MDIQTVGLSILPFTAVYNPLINGRDKLEVNIIYTGGEKLKSGIANFYDQTTKSLLFNFVVFEGALKIENIDLKKGPFFIIAHDPTGEHNAVIADNIGGPNYVDN